MMQIDNPESYVAQDIAGKAILFEIGAQAHILDNLESLDTVSVKQLSQKLNIKEDFVQNYFNVLENLSLVKKIGKSADEQLYQATPSYYVEKNKIGYVSWGMASCAPLIMNTRAFTTQFDVAVEKYTRCGEHVARTSKWMGEKDFYPHAEKVILELQPKKLIDLGSGTCGLLIRLAQKLPNMEGVGVDISKEACDKARAHITEIGLQQRISVIESPVQQLIEDKSVFENADVIHAGFVFHDLLPDEEETLNTLLKSINQRSPTATLVIVDAIPFSQNPNETAFSSAFTFLHKFFMGRRLLSENEWQSKLNSAGFKNVHIERLGISGGRIFIAKS